MTDGLTIEVRDDALNVQTREPAITYLADFLLWYDGNLNPARGRDVEQARATARDYLYPDGE
jgi:hypothetical protein